MAQTARDGRRADPVSVLTQAMRRVVTDPGEITRSLASLAKPNGGGFLDMLGQTREERVEKMAAMLRNSSEADMEEMGNVFALAMAKVVEEQASGAGMDGTRLQTEELRPDPVSMLADGMKRVISFDLADITRGLENFANPSAGGMLDMLGRTREERVAKMAAMLGKGSDADMEEMGIIFALATAQVAEDKAGGSDQRDAGRPRAERPRRPRGMTSAEWREARRRAP